MNEYLKNWYEIIVNCRFDNSYKMAWARSIVELCFEEDKIDNNITFSFYKIAKKCLKYYWNQTIYFDLNQSNNLKKLPEIINCTKDLIKKYYENKKDKIPIRFEKAESKINKDDLNKSIKIIVRILKQDVCWRFLKVDGEEYDIYNLNKKDAFIEISKDHAFLIKDYADFLLQIINYKWTQMLEGFNSSPKISLKVRATGGDSDIKRKNLKVFHKYLNLEFSDEKARCFFCGKEISNEELSVDHIVPWSFMFSDDIWNLVFCHKSENSSKSNKIVSEDVIIKLEKRNINLLKKLEKKGIKDKKADELKGAIEHNYVRKFWISSKG